MMPAHCPNCHGQLRLLSSVYPVSVCAICGTALHGHHEYPAVITPRIVSALAESRDKCLRDDRAECMVYLAAKQSLEA